MLREGECRARAARTDGRPQPSPAARRSPTTGRASSTPCRSLLLVIIFLLSLFMLTQFFLGQEILGKDTALTRLNIQIAELTELLQLERASADDLEVADRDPDRDARRRRRPSAMRSRRRSPASAPATTARTREIAGLTTELGAAAGHLARGAGAGRAAQPAAQRAAHPDRRAGAGARGLRGPRHREPHRRSPISAAGSTSRSPSACRTSRATAPTSSAACAKSSKAAPTSASSATASCSSPKCCSTPARRDHLAEGTAELAKLADAVIELESRDPARHELGAAHRRPHRQAPDQQRRSSPPTGS